MALDRRKMQFVKGVVLTRAQEEERQRNARKYKGDPRLAAALIFGLTALGSPYR